MNRSESILKRCYWCEVSDRMRDYHDHEWGFPIHDDNVLFGYLMYEVMQCGLSWRIVVEKKDIFDHCFEGFDLKKVALYTEADELRILDYPGMIRSKAKIHAIVHNAGCILKIAEEFGSFDRYLWAYTDDKTLVYEGHDKPSTMIAKNALSEKLAKDLKKRGLKYLGPVTVYSFLQACGMVNDHTSDCSLYEKINRDYPIVRMKADEDA